MLRPLRLQGSALHGYAIILCLWLAAAAGWVWLIAASMQTMVMPGAPAMGLSLAGFLLFWTVMMVAMMFPSAAPMVQAYYAINRRRAKAQTATATIIFLIGYLVLSILSGVAAYALAALSSDVIQHYNLSPQMTARLGGGVILAAGLYQLTPIKHLCLSKCGTPISFIMTSWRQGLRGAFRMGWEHGLYCLGCCWMLFVLLFPLGMMNVMAMAAITVLIFAEKIFRLRRRLARLAGAALIFYGLLVILMPQILPVLSVGTAPGHPMTMRM